MSLYTPKLPESEDKKMGRTIRIFDTTLRDGEHGQLAITQAEVRQGYLESSNADLATELGKVIEAQRAYSYALRMVTTADEVETTVVNLAN